MAGALKALLRGIRKLLRPLGAGGLPRPTPLAKAAESLRSSAERLRPRPLADRSLPEVVRRWSPKRSDPSKENEDIERPSEADLPEAVAGADGLPVQQAVLVAVPLEIAYNQFTQFEDFAGFMRTLAKADQIDAVQVEFDFRRWPLRRSWKAHIVDQRPEERIAWRSVEGMRLSGVTTFHSIADRLTRVDVSVVVEAAGAAQRIAHRLGFVDRVIAGELRRFKAFVEMREEETGAWRGYVADGEVVDEDEYFGWEPSDDDGEAGAKDEGSSPPEPEEGAEQESRSKATAAKRSTKEATAGQRSARNGASAEKSGGKGASKGKSNGSGRQRTGAGRKTSGSRSRA